MRNRPRLTKDGKLITPSETRIAAKKMVKGVKDSTHFQEINGKDYKINWDMTQKRTLTRKQVKQFSWIIIMMDHKPDYETYCKKILKQIYPWIASKNVEKEYKRAFRKIGDYDLQELI